MQAIVSLVFLSLPATVCPAIEPLMLKSTTSKELASTGAAEGLADAVPVGPGLAPADAGGVAPAAAPPHPTGPSATIASSDSQRRPLAGLAEGAVDRAISVDELTTLSQRPCGSAPA